MKNFPKAVRQETWRAVYSVQFSDVIYVLHAFQKKSKKGLKTPQKEIELVESRLKVAIRDFEERQKNDKKKRE